MDKKSYKEFIKEYKRRLRKSKIVDYPINEDIEDKLIQNNTDLFVCRMNGKLESESISEEEKEAVIILLQAYFDYLKKDFDNNIEDIITFMKEVYKSLYLHFLNQITDDLINYANGNPDKSVDEIFSNRYVQYGDIDFDGIYDLISKFKSAKSIYYTKSLIIRIIGKTTDFGKLNISDEQITKLRSYIFNKDAKKSILSNLEFDTIDDLVLCFNEDIYDYFLDDEGLNIMDNANIFKKLMDSKISFDKLIKSKLFSSLLSKTYAEDNYEYDANIKYINKNLSDKKLIFELLNNYVEEKDYNHFYRVFKSLEEELQLEYFKNHLELISLNIGDLYKGMKKRTYEVFEDKIDASNFIYNIRDLSDILDNSSDYSTKQLELIFSNSKNINTIVNWNNYSIKEIYEKILKLNIPKLLDIYTKEDTLSKIRNNGVLDSIYEAVYDTKIENENILLNKNSLIDIGEENIEEFNYHKINSASEYPTLDTNNKYFKFMLYFYKLENKDIMFKILDFYLTNTKYLSTFYLLRNEMSEEDLRDYFTSRHDLITKIIKENKDISLEYILGDSKRHILLDDFSSDRENFILHCSNNDFTWLFDTKYEGKYRLSEDILRDDRFTYKFIDSYEDIKEELKLVCDNEELINELSSKINSYKKMRDYIVSKLNDDEEEFQTYLKILRNSGIDVYSIEFLVDMMDVLFYSKRVSEVFYKYKDIDYEAKKLEILDEVRRNSCEDIASSITNPLLEEKKNVLYKLDGKDVVIPTIVFDKDTFNFLVRRMDNGDHINTDEYEERIEYYSTITEKNRSVFYGNSGIKFGYVNVNPNDIVQVNSYDAISQNSRRNKYIGPYVKYPEWVSMDELNRRTYNRSSYNEIRIYGKHIPDYVLCYDDDITKETLKYSHEHNVPIVKILRKRYKDAIESCSDPYSNWH